MLKAWCIAVFVIAMTVTWPTYGADCNLKSAVQMHQQFDNFLDQKFDHYWYGTKPTPDYRALHLDEIVRRLPPDAALLFYATPTEPDDISPPKPLLAKAPPEFLCVWLLDRDGTVIEVKTTLDVANGIAFVALPDDIRSSLTRDDPARGWRGLGRIEKVVLATAEPRDPALALPPSVALGKATQLLLPERIRQLILSGRYGRLVIVPSRNLGSIPYAALPIDEERQLIDLVSLVVMPSFVALPDSTTVPHGAHIGRSLVVGDPELTKDDKLVRRGKFAALPGARDEAQRVAILLGVRPLLGTDASQSAVLQNVGNSDLIYIAAHGSYDDQNPNDRSFLVLSDGAFTARTIAKLKLPRRPIVVMSACQTGLGKTFESGVIGLAKAWKYAGASTVVMTLWSVYDEPTRDLMVEFMTLLQGGQDADLALRNAKRSVKAKARYSHPIYWAGFMIYGAPGRF